MPSFPIPEFQQSLAIQDFKRGILGISDIAGHLSGLRNGLNSRSSDSILTGYVRQMSVTLRSILLADKGHLFTRMLKNGLFPAWPQVQGELLATEVVEASPYQEIHYTIPELAEDRKLKVPGYKHGFVVNTLPGIGKSRDNRYTLLGSNEIWTSKKTVELRDWLQHEIFEVDGLIYDVEKVIKTVSDKEGAHIDQIVDSEGIYTGNRENTKSQHTNDEAYIRSRLVKFGPFSYPHIVVIVVSRYLVTIAKESLRRNEEQIKSIRKQIPLSPAGLSTIRERIQTIMTCPPIERIDGLPLRVRPERLVMRLPIRIGLESFEEEQVLANNRPQYGETYIGNPRSRTNTEEKVETEGIEHVSNSAVEAIHGNLKDE